MRRAIPLPIAEDERIPNEPARRAALANAQSIADPRDPVDDLAARIISCKSYLDELSYGNGDVSPARATGD